MDPALLNYMQSIEAQQQQVPPQEQQDEAPAIFSKGANAAIQAAKQSLGMNDPEKERAQGLGIMAFFNHLSKGGFGSGLNGNLAGITQSMNPAVQAYLQEEAGMKNLNAQLGSQYEQQRQNEQMMQQKMMQHQEAQAYKHAQLGETQRAHQAMEQHRAAQLGMQHGYQKESLALKRAGLDLKRASERQQKTGKIPPQLFTKLNKDLQGLKPLEELMKAYDAAEQLVQDEDSLYNPVAQAAFNVIGGRPKALQTPGQAEMEVLEGDIKAAKYSGKGLRSTVEFKSLGTPDPRLSKKANLAIITRAKEALKPSYEKMKKMEELYGRLLGGEQLDSEDFADYFGSSQQSLGFPSQQQISPQQEVPIESSSEKWVPMTNPSGQPVEVHPGDVTKSLGQGYKRI